MGKDTEFEGNKPYNDYGSWIRTQFPFRVQKISVDAGFSCPNRDGHVSHGGCSFCDNRSFSPQYCEKGKAIAQQIKDGKDFFAKKYPSMKYIAYFQAFTNIAKTALLRFARAENVKR